MRNVRGVVYKKGITDDPENILENKTMVYACIVNIALTRADKYVGYEGQQPYSLHNAKMGTTSAS